MLRLVTAVTIAFALADPMLTRIGLSCTHEHTAH